VCDPRSTALRYCLGHLDFFWACVDPHGSNDGLERHILHVCSCVLCIVIVIASVFAEQHTFLVSCPPQTVLGFRQYCRGRICQKSATTSHSKSPGSCINAGVTGRGNGVLQDSAVVQTVRCSVFLSSTFLET
jgi:hypothetical protein